MAVIKNIRQETNYRFLNFFTLDAVNKAGNPKEYYVVSRARSIDELKMKTRVNKPDGVTIYSLYGEKRDKVVLVRQYRYPVDHFVYEFPSGIVDEGETYREAAVREMKEETGLVFRAMDVDPAYEMPRFQTVGMTDESCAMVFGFAEGIPTSAGEEEGGGERQHGHSPKAPLKAGQITERVSFFHRVLPKRASARASSET